MSHVSTDTAHFPPSVLFRRRTPSKMKHSSSTPLPPVTETSPKLLTHRSEGGEPMDMKSPPLKSPSTSAQKCLEGLVPVKYGDVIRLCTKLNESDVQLATVGTYDMESARTNLKLHKCDSLVCVALPSEPNFTPSYYRILPECYYAHLKLGSPVSYGEVVVLVDMNNCVWNNKIGFEFNGHFAPSEKLNRPGEMTIAFRQRTDQDIAEEDPDSGLYYGEENNSRAIYYGDVNVLIQVVDSNRLRLGFNQILTMFRKKNTPIVHGGYLRCDGRGTTLRVELQGLPPPCLEALTLEVDGQSHPISFPDHKDITGLTASLVGPSIGVVHFTFQENLGKVSFTLKELQDANGAPLSLVALNGQRSLRVSVRGVILVSDKVQTRSYTVHIAVLLVTMMYIAAIFSGSITTRNFYGMTMVWFQPLLSLGWLIKQAKDLRHQVETEFVSFDLTILSWEYFTAEELAVQNLVESATAVPRCFIVAEMGNAAKALERYHDTLAWRREHQMDQILTIPQAHYSTIRKHYKQCIHKHDKVGHPLYIEKMGSIDLKALQSQGIRFSDLFKHYLFNVEYIFMRLADEKCICPSCKESHTMKMCIILDARGVGMRDLAGETLEFVRSCTSVMQKHYPQRSFKIFLVNVPSWFGMIWKLIKPLLNETTRAKTFILSEHDVPSTLLQYIDAANLPEEYGGTCHCLGGCFEKSEFQIEQQKYVDQLQGEETPQTHHKGEVCADIEESDDEGELWTNEDNPHKQTHSLLKHPIQILRKESNIHSGYLLMRLIRQKHFVNPIWLRRLVSLTPHHVNVQKSPKDQLVKYQLTPGSYVKANEKPNCFEVVMEGHSLLFYAETPELRAEWLDAFNQVVEPQPSPPVIVA